jgi:nitrite reductase (NADH) small subunit
MSQHWVDVGSIEKIPPGTGQLVMGAFEKPIAVFNVEGNFYAINAICPHMGGPLQSGVLNENVITCPWHGWTFCVDTGEADHPGGHRISTYQVKVQENKIWVGWLRNPG